MDGWKTIVSFRGELLISGSVDLLFFHLVPVFPINFISAPGWWVVVGALAGKSRGHPLRIAYTSSISAFAKAQRWTQALAALEQSLQIEADLMCAWKAERFTPIFFRGDGSAKKKQTWYIACIIRLIVLYNQFQFDTLMPLNLRIRCWMYFFF